MREMCKTIFPVARLRSAGGSVRHYEKTASEYAPQHIDPEAVFTF